MDAKRQLDRLAHRERLSGVRNWCFGLAFATLAAGIGSIGGISIGNPKTWASAFEALAAAGTMRWLVLPLLIVGSILLCAAVVLTIVLMGQDE